MGVHLVFTEETNTLGDRTLVLVSADKEWLYLLSRRALQLLLQIRRTNYKTPIRIVQLVNRCALGVRSFGLKLLLLEGGEVLLTKSIII